MLAFHWSDPIAERGPRMHQYNQHRKAWRGALIVITIVIGFLPVRMAAHAQSSSSAPVPGADSPLGDANISSDDEAGSPVAEASGASNDGTAANPIDASTAAPVDNSDDGSVAPTTGTASNEPSASGSEDGAVLEIPQAVNLQGAGAPREETEGAAASNQNDDDQTRPSNPAGQETGALDNPATTAAQVGSLQEYENQANEAPPGPIFFGPGIAVVRFPHPLFFNSPPRPLVGPRITTSPVILPPTSSGPFPSTSPMLMAPRVGIAGSFPRHGLMGFHR